MNGYVRKYINFRYNNKKKYGEKLRDIIDII
jgi:hypothetical protein